MLEELLCSQIPGLSGVNVMVDCVSVESETKVSLSKKHPVVVLMALSKFRVTCTDAVVCCTENDPTSNWLNKILLIELQCS